MGLARQPPRGSRAPRCQPAVRPPRPMLCPVGPSHAASYAPATTPQPRYPIVYEYACPYLHSPATASAERPQLNGAASLRLLMLLRLSGWVIVGVVPDEKRCLAVACRIMDVIVYNAVHGEATP